MPRTWRKEIVMSIRTETVQRLYASSPPATWTVPRPARSGRRVGHAAHPAVVAGTYHGRDQVR